MLGGQPHHLTLEAVDETVGDLCCMELLWRPGFGYCAELYCKKGDLKSAPWQLEHFNTHDFACGHFGCLQQHAHNWHNTVPVRGRQQL